MNYELITINTAYLIEDSSHSSASMEKSKKSTLQSSFKLLLRYPAQKLSGGVGGSGEPS